MESNGIRKRNCTRPSIGFFIIVCGLGSSVLVPEFYSEPQRVVADAIAKSTRAGSAREPEVATLEQMGEVRPSAMSPVVSVASNSEGMLSAPSFIWICGSTSVTQSSAVDLSTSLNVSVPIYTSPIVSVGAISGLNKAFILGLGRPPIPAKTVTQIVAF